MRQEVEVNLDPALMREAGHDMPLDECGDLAPLSVRHHDDELLHCDGLAPRCSGRGQLIMVARYCEASALARVTGAWTVKARA